MHRSRFVAVAASLSANGGRPVNPVEPEFLAMVRADSDVGDWLISMTEIQKTRDEYAEHLAKFLQWANLTPSRVFEIKQQALKEGSPSSAVETSIKRFNEALRGMEYAGKTRAKIIAAICSFIQSKGYPIPRKLVRLDMTDKLAMRVPKREEIEFFLQYAASLEEKVLYTFMTETPCRPRVFPALRWNRLEPEWWSKAIVHVILPKQFRPGNQAGPRKFEPVMFLGPKSIDFLKQLRDARIRLGHPPLETERILSYTKGAMGASVRRDFDTLVRLGLIRTSRTDEKGQLIEQPIAPQILAQIPIQHHRRPHRCQPRMAPHAKRPRDLQGENLPSTMVRRRESLLSRGNEKTPRESRLATGRC